MNEDFTFLLFFFGISMTLNLALGFAWFRAARRVRRLEDHILAPPPGPSDDRRVDRLEQSMDTLSAQMDQLANGQEFLNRVMAERLDRLPRGGEPQHENTPH